MITAESYPLSWPQGWPRTPTNKRQRARFGKVERKYSADGAHSWDRRGDLSIYGAMLRLTDELGRLGGSRFLISTNVETRSDRKPPDDPGVAVYFTLAGKDRVLACDKWDRVPDNIAAIAAHIDAIRRQERYGVGTLEQAFAGYAALPPPGQPFKREWWRVLMFAGPMEGPTALEHAEIMYRKLARERHPDFGGTTEQMAELNAAIAEARKELRA